MLSFSQGLDTNGPESKFFERVVQGNRFLKGSLIESRLNGRHSRNTEESRVENIFNFIDSGLVLERLLHFHMGIKANPNIPFHFCLDEKHVFSWLGSREEAGMVFIALDIVDPVEFPFIARAGNVHILFESRICDVFSEVASRHFLLIELLGEEVAEFRIGIFQRCPLLGKLNTHSKHPFCRHIEPYPKRSPLRFQIQTVLDTNMLRCARISGSCIEFVEISHDLFLGHDEGAFKVEAHLRAVDLVEGCVDYWGV